MMIPHWSDKHHRKQARKIYHVAFWPVFVLGFLASIPLYVGFRMSVEQMLDTSNDWWLSDTKNVIPTIVVIVAMNIAHARGIAALRRAGLLQEVTQVIIDKTEAHQIGPTIKVNLSRWNKLRLLFLYSLFCVVFLLLAGLYLEELPLRIIGFAAAILTGVLAFLSLVNINQPEVRLDDRGVFVCPSGQYRKLVTWPEIARARFQSSGNVPDTFLLRTEHAEIIALEDRFGKSLLTIDCNLFAIAPETKVQFIAELKRRLRGTPAGHFGEHPR